mmetsp:Transcript_5925/g.10700  ORF Transcript_5925/g.10700 Transcript_5925/m.10700 type:complete len:96 (-) Transcript_5925:169-456(-)
MLFVVALKAQIELHTTSDPQEKTRNAWHSPKIPLEVPPGFPYMTPCSQRDVCLPGDQITNRAYCSCIDTCTVIPFAHYLHSGTFFSQSSTSKPDD